MLRLPPRHDLRRFHLLLQAAAMGVSLCGAAAAWGCLLAPLEAARQRHLAQLDRRRDAQQAAAEVEDIDRQLQRLLAERRAELDELRRRVPPAAEEGAALQMVDRAAEQHRVEVTGIAPGKRERSGRVSWFSIRLSCRGSFAALCSFADRLHRLPRLCQVTALRIESGEAEQHAAELTLRAYFDLQPHDGSDGQENGDGV